MTYAGNDKRIEQIKEIAEQLDFTELTELQQAAFEEEAFFDPYEWLFVTGATSSGKTLIPLMHFFRRCIDGESPKMLFAVPYRALAQQKCDEIRSLLQELGLDLKVVQSTSEFRLDDSDIRSGEVDVAVIIYEKVFQFSCMDSRFLEHYDLLVCDEIGLSQDVQRGLKVDFMLARARQLPKLKVIALGTPFYEWSEYIKTYGFKNVYNARRQSECEIHPIYYRKRGSNPNVYIHISNVSGCEAIKEGRTPFIPNPANTENPKQSWDEIVVNLCIYHLKQKHKILIFINSRDEVRKFSHRLLTALKLNDMGTMWITPENCKSYISNLVNVRKKDIDSEYYGILGENDYEAFSYGLGYHSAQIPNRLRTVVERDILRDDGHLQIVCCTETLAYGINSNVDVIIIPIMKKQNLDKPNAAPEFLKANEFMNYAGRAGRLQRGSPVDGTEIHGYVYPLLNCIYEPDPDKERAEEQRLWEKLEYDIAHPQTIYSRWRSVDASYKPFFLLSLFDTSESRNPSLTVRQLERRIRCMPLGGDGSIDLENDLLSQLDYLVNHRLLRRDETFWDNDEIGNRSYHLSDIGSLLSGYIISTDDFDRMNAELRRIILDGDVVKAAVDKNDELRIPIVDLLCAVTDTKGITDGAMYFTRDLNRVVPATLRETVVGILCQNAAFMTEHTKERFSRELDFSFDDQKLRESPCCKIPSWILFLAVLLMCIGPNCSQEKMFKQFHLTYALTKRLAEQVSYRLDILALTVPTLTTDSGLTLIGACGTEAVGRISDSITELSQNVFYLVSRKVCRFLDAESANPEDAAELQKAAKLLRELEQLENHMHRKKGFSANDRQRLYECREELTSLREEWYARFRNRFEEVLNND